MLNNIITKGLKKIQVFFQFQGCSLTKRFCEFLNKCGDVGVAVSVGFSISKRLSSYKKKAVDRDVLVNI